MDQTWLKMTQENISEHVSKINFNDPNFSLNELKQEIAKLTGGIVPSIKLKWNTKERINELKRDAGLKDYKEITEKVEEILITFIDHDDQPVPHQIKLIV